MNTTKIKKILEQHKIWVTSFGEKGIKANLSGADLCGANLCGANLSDADLRGADLCDANLSDANLCGADLCGANLCGANLSDADLSGADLCGANLCGANLSDANLRGANLRGANLSNADLCGANLCGVDLPESTFIILGEIYFISIINGESVRAGCQCHLINDWRKFSKQEIAQMDGKRALRFYPRLIDIIDFYCGKGDRPDWLKEELGDEHITA